MNGVLCWDGNIIFLFTVRKCGPRKSAECAQWRKLGSWNTNFYAEITSCWQISWHLKGYAWKDWQFHVAWTRLRIPSHSLLRPCYLTLSNPRPSVSVLRTLTFLSYPPSI